MQVKKSEKPTPRGVYRPKFTFFHPNPKGTGTAVSMEVHPAHDNIEGSIFLSAANQLTVGDRTGDAPVYPRFDWENKMTVRLCFEDLCQILLVLRGQCESINEGRGLFHSTSEFNTRIGFRHLIEPVPGYSLELSRMPVKPGACEQRARILFTNAEAFGISEAISGSMATICFGMPMVIRRDEAAMKENYARQNQKSRYVAA